MDVSTVWVVFGVQWCIGGDFYGVFSSKAKAEHAVEKLQSTVNFPTYDEYKIVMSHINKGGKIVL